MLPRRLFMMGRAYFKSHIFQVQDNIPPHIFCKVHRPHIKITGLLVSHSSRLSVVVDLKQEKLTFRLHFKYIPHLLCFFHDPL